MPCEVEASNSCSRTPQPVLSTWEDKPASSSFRFGQLPPHCCYHMMTLARDTSRLAQLPGASELLWCSEHSSFFISITTLVLCLSLSLSCPSAILSRVRRRLSQVIGADDSRSWVARGMLPVGHNVLSSEMDTYDESRGYTSWPFSRGRAKQGMAAAVRSQRLVGSRSYIIGSLERK